MRAPYISIIIPTYKRPEMLDRALRSVYDQTFQDYEVIIIIDGGVENYKAAELNKNSKVKVIINESNKGVSESRNIGIKNALGKYIAFLDDDDEYTSDFLAKTYKVISTCSEEVGLSWCNVKHVYSNHENGKVNISYKYTKYENNHNSKSQLFEDFITIGLGFGVVIKLECFNKIGLFNSDLKLVDDTDLFLRIINLGYMPIVIPNAQVIVHHHDVNRLTGYTYNDKRIMETKLLLKKYKNLFNEYKTLKINLEKYIEHLELKTG